MRFLTPGLAGCILAVSLAAAIIKAISTQAIASEPGLFGSPALFSPDLKPFTKWNAVVGRSESQSRAFSDYCSERGEQRTCVGTQWRQLIAELRTLPILTRIARVNDLLNRVPYVAAQSNWHKPEYWETPFEFLQYGGQCEDYAIAKFMALEASGVREQDLRFVMVHDKYLSLDHAIAVVYVDDEPFVLDNQIKDVTLAAQLDRYSPYYAINRVGWWYFDHRHAN